MPASIWKSSTNTLQKSMPVYSMTGFAATPIDSEPHKDSDKPQETQVQFELRSVNSRFLDLHFKLPESLRTHEIALRACIKQHVKRGKVEIRAKLIAPSTAPTNNAQDTYAPSPDALQQLAQAQEAVLQQFPQAARLTVADVLQHHAKDTHNTLDEPPSETHVQAAMQSAIQALQTTRAREGFALQKVMLEATATIKQLATQASPLIPTLVEQQRQRFLARWEDALGTINNTNKNADTTPNTAAAQERALTEATAYALRIDVAEELNRLQLHLDEIDSILLQENTSPQAKGKRLEFLIQELHREANTLGSKSSTMELSRISVDMKVQIEQLREQVQNIE